MQTTYNSLVKNQETGNTAIAQEINSFKMAVTLVEAYAARVRKMHNNDEKYRERKLWGLNGTLDKGYTRNKTTEQGLEAEVLKCTKEIRKICQKYLREEMIEEEKKRLQKRIKKSKDKRVQWQMTTVPVLGEVCEYKM